MFDKACDEDISRSRAGTRSVLERPLGAKAGHKFELGIFIDAVDFSCCEAFVQNEVLARQVSRVVAPLVPSAVRSLDPGDGYSAAYVCQYPMLHYLALIDQVKFRVGSKLRCLDIVRNDMVIHDHIQLHLSRRVQRERTCKSTHGLGSGGYPRQAPHAKLALYAVSERARRFWIPLFRCATFPVSRTP